MTTRICGNYYIKNKQNSLGNRNLKLIIANITINCRTTDYLAIGRRGWLAAGPGLTS
jgi:hypothetical protein